MNYPDELKQRMDFDAFVRAHEYARNWRKQVSKDKEKIDFERRVKEELGEGWDG